MTRGRADTTLVDVTYLAGPNLIDMRSGYIPHVLVLDVHGEPLYNQSGEVDSAGIEDLFRRSAGQ